MGNLVNGSSKSFFVVAEAIAACRPGRLASRQLEAVAPTVATERRRDVVDTLGDARVLAPGGWPMSRRRPRPVVNVSREIVHHGRKHSRYASSIAPSQLMALDNIPMCCRRPTWNASEDGTACITPPPNGYETAILAPVSKVSLSAAVARWRTM